MHITMLFNQNSNRSNENKSKEISIYLSEQPCGNAWFYKLVEGQPAFHGLAELAIIALTWLSTYCIIVETLCTAPQSDFFSLRVNSTN